MVVTSSFLILDSGARCEGGTLDIGHGGRFAGRSGRTAGGAFGAASRGARGARDSGLVLRIAASIGRGRSAELVLLIIHNTGSNKNVERKGDGPGRSKGK